MGASARQRKSRRILEKLLRSPVFRRSKHVMTYIAMHGEVETRSLIAKSLALKKHLYVPLVNRRTKEIKALKIHHPVRDLRRGAYGILEPVRRRVKPADPAALDLIVVPGLGFDRGGRRLGRGRGCFDRFLKKAKAAAKVGLAFREQIVRRIPTERHDVPVDRVITD